MEKKTDHLKTGRMFRHLALAREGLNVKERTAEIAFSSEEPYERFFGIEILDHSPQSIRLGRLNDGGAVLRNHDTDRHIGVVERAAIGTDRVGRARIRFGKSDDAEAAFQDVQDGILRHVSVGYFIHRMVMESEDQGRETYRVLDWEPMEVSLVPIPADPTVGVGRAAEDSVQTLVERTVPDAPKPETTVVALATPPITTLKGTKIMESPKPLEGVEAERERVKALIAIGAQYSRYIGEGDVTAAIRDGKTIDQFKDLVMDKMQTKHTDTSALRIGMGAKEVQRYSLARAVVASMTGNWGAAGLELEASRAVGKLLKQEPQGFFVPWDAFTRDFNVGTGSEAGNLVPTELRTDLFVDVLRNNLVLGQLGIRILAGLTATVDMPKKTVASTVGMATEIQALSETNPNTGKVTLTPKRLGAYVEYSKQALIQSAMAIEPMLRDDLLQGAAVLIQDQVINGSGSGANMRGIRSTSGIGSVVGGTNGAALAWSHLVDLESACANANAEPDAVSGYLLNTKTRGAAKKTQKGSNLPFIWDNGAQPLNGYRAAVSNTVPSNLTKGTSTTIASSLIFGSDWSMSVLGLFGAPDVTVDPYSLATTGQVRITLNQFADHGVRLAACFASMEDLLA